MGIFIKFYANHSLGIRDIELGIITIEKLTSIKLNFSIQKGKLIRIDSISKFLCPMEEEIYYKKNIPLITSAEEGGTVLISGNFLSYLTANMWYLVLEIRKKLLPNDLAQLFYQLTILFGGYWATTSNGNTESKFARQSFSSYEPTSKKDLPKLPHIDVYDSPYIPGNLGWINYWPAPALKRIGFKAHHRSLFHSVQDAANDGLILQITEEPLDFDIAEHLRKTVAIYDALPAIGGRDCV